MIGGPLVITPALRRYLANGFRHNPLKDAPAYGYVCMESGNQRVYVNPENGMCRVGATVRQ